MELLWSKPSSSSSPSSSSRVFSKYPELPSKLLFSWRKTFTSKIEIHSFLFVLCYLLSKNDPFGFCWFRCSDRDTFFSIEAFVFIIVSFSLSLRSKDRGDHREIQLRMARIWWYSDSFLVLWSISTLQGTRCFWGRRLRVWDGAKDWWNRLGFQNQWSYCSARSI